MFGLHDIFDSKSGCEEDVMVAEQAEYLVSNMKQRSPLALCTMHRLLEQGAEKLTQE